DVFRLGGGIIAYASPLYQRGTFLRATPRGRERQAMTRFLPPVLGIVLLVMWLVLNITVTPGQILLGALLSLFLLLAISRLRPLHATLRRTDLTVRLLWRVLLDVVRSNNGVARIILGPVHDREIRSGFLDVPLQLRDPHGL